MHRDKTQQLHVYNSVIESTNVVCVTKSLECCDKHKRNDRISQNERSTKTLFKLVCTKFCIQNKCYVVTIMCTHKRKQTTKVHISKTD